MVKCIFFAVEVGYYNSLGKQVVNKQKTSPSQVMFVAKWHYCVIMQCLHASRANHNVEIISAGQQW